MSDQGEATKRVLIAKLHATTQTWMQTFLKYSGVVVSLHKKFWRPLQLLHYGCCEEKDKNMKMPGSYAKGSVVPV